jgi:hypothetical protein
MGMNSFYHTGGAMRYYHQLWSSHFRGQQLSATAQFPSKEVHCIIFLKVICMCSSQVKSYFSFYFGLVKIISFKLSFTVINRNGDICTLTADFCFCTVVMWKRNPLNCVKEGCHKYPGIRVQALQTTLKLVKIDAFDCVFLDKKYTTHNPVLRPYKPTQV